MCTAFSDIPYICMHVRDPVYPGRVQRIAPSQQQIKFLKKFWIICTRRLDYCGDRRTETESESINETKGPLLLHAAGNPQVHISIRMWIQSFSSALYWIYRTDTRYHIISHSNTDTDELNGMQTNCF